jgi:sec-independent protein translocase protein TatA
MACLWQQVLDDAPAEQPFSIKCLQKQNTCSSRWNSQKGNGTMPGRYEWLIVLLVIILLFGAKRLPEVAKGLGKGIREFKKAKEEIDDEVDKANKEIKEQVRDLDA